jgi:proline racemase
VFSLQILIGGDFRIIDQTRKFESPTGSKFNAKLIREVKYAEYDAVVVEISGHGYYTGKSKCKKVKMAIHCVKAYEVE